MQVEVKLKKLLHINDAKGFVLEIFVNSVCIRKYIAYYFTEKIGILILEFVRNS